jgi:hypothetical protein
MEKTNKDNVTNKFQPKGTVKVIKGTIIMPEAGGLKFILSLANLAGKPEGNPLLPLFDKKWSKVRAEARGFFANKTGAYKLGALAGTTATQSDVWVQHMICQDKDLKIDLKALEECLKKVTASALFEKASLHVSALLVAAIPELPDMLVKYCVDRGVSVYIYEEKSDQ